MYRNNNTIIHIYEKSQEKFNFINSPYDRTSDNRILNSPLPLRCLSFFSFLSFTSFFACRFYSIQFPFIINQFKLPALSFYPCSLPRNLPLDISHREMFVFQSVALIAFIYFNCDCFNAAAETATTKIAPGNSDYAYYGCYNETTGDPSVGNKRALAGGSMVLYSFFRPCPES